MKNLFQVMRILVLMVVLFALGSYFRQKQSDVASNDGVFLTAQADAGGDTPPPDAGGDTPPPGECCEACGGACC